MLVLSSLPKLLQRALAPPDLHTAVLFTSAGALVAFASSPIEGTNAPRPKDDVRVLVGLAGEIWAESRTEGEGVADSELGRIIVLPIAPIDAQTRNKPESEPILLLALNGSETIEWGELERKGRSLATYLQKPLMQLQDKLTTPGPAPQSSRSSRR